MRMRFIFLIMVVVPFVTGCVATVSAPPTSPTVYSGPSGATSDLKNHPLLSSNPTLVSPIERDIKAQLHLLDSTFKTLQKHNADLCQKILHHTNLKNCNWLFLKGHNLPTINSFPWNDLYINVTSSLLSYVENEDEMAFVLAHEMGHQLAEHVTENLPSVTTSFNFKTDLPRLILCGICVVGTASGANYAETAQAQNALLGEITDSYFTDRQEKEADYIATYLLIRAGYDLEKGLIFLQKMSILNPKTGEKLKTNAGYFDTHSYSENRFMHFILNQQEIAAKRNRGAPLYPTAD